MEKIYLRDIDFGNLTKIMRIENNSELHYDKLNRNFYKMYNYPDKKRNKIFEELSNLDEIENVIIPHTVILHSKLKKKKIEGCISTYIPNTMKMFDYFDVFPSKKEDFYKIMNESSKTLQNIHSKDIVLGDVSFNNILFDMENNHYYCDLDSIVVDQNDCNIAGLIGWYYRYKNLDDIKINDNFDRFSFFLHFSSMIFGTKLNQLTEYKIDEEIEKFPFIYDMKDLLFFIKNRDQRIPKVPYLHEIIPEQPKIYQKK